jgi:hypothetical protein
VNSSHNGKKSSNSTIPSGLQSIEYKMQDKYNLRVTVYNVTLWTPWIVNSLSLGLSDVQDTKDIWPAKHHDAAKSLHK